MEPSLSKDDSRAQLLQVGHVVTCDHDGHSTLAVQGPDMECFTYRMSSGCDSLVRLRLRFRI